MEPELGKIYQRERGGIVQIIQMHPHLEAQSLTAGYIIIPFVWEMWKNRCRIIATHPKMSILCVDCQKFCQQQCYKQTSEWLEIKLPERQYYEYRYNVWD